VCVANSSETLHKTYKIDSTGKIEILPQLHMSYDALL